MHARRFVALSTLSALALGSTAYALHAEDGYVRKVPLNPYLAPLPVPVPAPPGSSLDLRPPRPVDSGEVMSGYSSTREAPAPSIGLSIKSPFEDRK
ncbi:MAG TPA: hypothetical protein VEH02_06185 [Pseudolabrys sp.]|nr:hypothetical protein [Pseudolabrys sp.]